MGYVGAKDIDALIENAQFVEISGAGPANHIHMKFKLQRMHRTIQSTVKMTISYESVWLV